MANFLRFTKAREISLTTPVRLVHSREAIVPVYTGGLLSPAAIASGAAFVCDRPSTSPAERPDRSGKTQTAEPFQEQYTTETRLLPQLKLGVSGAEVCL